MNRALRRAAPIALASAAALFLAGCAGGTAPDASETPAAAECMDVASGSVERRRHRRGRVLRNADGDLHHPAEATELERTIAIEGDGDDTVAGEPINVVVTAFSGTSGEQVFSQPTTIKAGDEAVFEAFRAGIDCVPIGSRTVTVAPP